MTDIEYIKKAIRELGPDATLDQVLRLVDAMKNMDAVKSGAGDAAAEGGGGDDVEMAASRAGMVATAQVLLERAKADGAAQKRSTEAQVQSDAPAAPVAQVQAEDPMAKITAAAEASGMSVEEWIDAAISAMAGPAPEAPDVAMAMARIKGTEEVLAHVRSELAAARREADGLEGQLLSRDIDVAVERGHVTDSEAKTLRAFVDDAGGRPRIRARLDEASKAPAVPTGTLVRPADRDRRGAVGTVMRTKGDHEHDEARGRTARMVRGYLPKASEDEVSAEVERIMTQAEARLGGKR